MATSRDIAAYLLDRADQYTTSSPCWFALADAARAVMKGDVDEAVAHGELAQGDVYARVDRMATGGIRRRK